MTAQETRRRKTPIPKKILYLTPVGKKVELMDLETTKGSKILDLDPIRLAVASGIKDHFKDVVIEEVADLVHRNVSVSEILAAPYDLCICDLSTCNPNILYIAGRAEGAGKPVIYFRSHDSDYPMSLESKVVLSYSDSSLHAEFKSALNRLITKVLKDPTVLSVSPAQENRQKIFISYSHQDRAYLDRLLVHLKPLARLGLLDVWVDTKIKVGDRWQDSIEKALKSSSAAILLVSADFLASDFIVDNELPPLLTRAEVDGTKIIPVVLSPCRFARDKNLGQFQAANPPTQPLSTLSITDREAVFDSVAHDIEKSLQKG